MDSKASFFKKWGKSITQVLAASTLIMAASAQASVFINKSYFCKDGAEDATVRTSSLQYVFMPTPGSMTMYEYAFGVNGRGLASSIVSHDILAGSWYNTFWGGSIAVDAAQGGGDATLATFIRVYHSSGLSDYTSDSRRISNIVPTVGTDANGDWNYWQDTCEVSVKNIYI